MLKMPPGQTLNSRIPAILPANQVETEIFLFGNSTKIHFSYFVKRNIRGNIRKGRIFAGKYNRKVFHKQAQDFYFREKCLLVRENDINRHIFPKFRKKARCLDDFRENELSRTSNGKSFIFDPPPILCWECRPKKENVHQGAVILTFFHILRYNHPSLTP